MHDPKVHVRLWIGDSGNKYWDVNVNSKIVATIVKRKAPYAVKKFGFAVKGSHQLDMDTDTLEEAVERCLKEILEMEPWKNL